MPIYEYMHDEPQAECQEIVDALQKMADDPLVTCPHCGEPVHKIVSRTHAEVYGESMDVNAHIRRKRGLSRGEQAFTVPTTREVVRYRMGDPNRKQKISEALIRGGYEPEEAAVENIEIMND